MIVTWSRTSRRPVMHRASQNYFQRLQFLPRRLKIAGPAQQAVLVGLSLGTIQLMDRWPGYPSAFRLERRQTRWYPMNDLCRVL